MRRHVFGSAIACGSVVSPIKVVRCGSKAATPHVRTRRAASTTALRQVFLRRSPEQREGNPRRTFPEVAEGARSALARDARRVTAYIL